jgi:hypothetical protein
MYRFCACNHLRFVECVFPILQEAGANLKKLNPFTLVRMIDIKERWVPLWHLIHENAKASHFSLPFSLIGVNFSNVCMMKQRLGISNAQYSLASLIRHPRYYDTSLRVQTFLSQTPSFIQLRHYIVTFELSILSY